MLEGGRKGGRRAITTTSLREKQGRQVLAPASSPPLLPSLPSIPPPSLLTIPGNLYAWPVEGWREGRQGGWMRNEGRENKGNAEKVRVWECEDGDEEMWKG